MPCNLLVDVPAKVRTNAVVNQSTVTLDAAALAADLSEALQLQEAITLSAGCVLTPERNVASS